MGLLSSLFKRKKPDYGLLNEMVNKPLVPGSYGYTYGMTESAYGDTALDNTMMPKWQARGIYHTPTDDGMRYYFGQDESFDRQTARGLARADANRRANMFPGDSLTTEQYQQFYKHGMYE